MEEERASLEMDEEEKTARRSRRGRAHDTGKRDETKEGRCTTIYFNIRPQIDPVWFDACSEMAGLFYCSF